ncbi:MAG: putative metal-binding motif-containing protein [Pseudomonadota bacterium]
MLPRAIRVLPLLLIGTSIALSVGCGEKDPDDTGTPHNENDADGDGYNSDEDCDDDDAAIHPEATEACDGVDNDCDGEVDEGLGSTWYTDSDGDGYGSHAGSVEACSQPDGYADNADDCDDHDDAIYPGAREVCDGEDNDCDGTIDEGAMTTWYADHDRDGYGDDGTTQEACDRPTGYVAEGGDCDDDDASVNPGATERCNGIDDDCDGRVDNNASDADTWYPDDDGDTYGDASDSGSTVCEQPSGTVADHSDCDDSDPDIHPGAAEHCDGVDEDCDGDVDNDAVDGGRYADDADGDGFGALGSMAFRCDGVENELDCDDSDSSEPQVVDAASTGRPDGTLAHPWPTIQEGIDNASQCVVVAAGLYSENIDFGGNDVAVTSIDGAPDTTIDGSGGGPVVTFANGEGVGALMAGFTLTGGTGFEETSSSTHSCGSGDICTDYYTTWCGGGVYIDGATPTLMDLTLDSNQLTTPADSIGETDSYYYYSYGGGMCVRNATFTTHALNFWNNWAEDGGAVYVESTGDLTIEQTELFSNHAIVGGAFEVDGGGLTMTNVLTAWNTAQVTGGSVLAVNAALSMTNCVSGEDDATEAGGMLLSGTTTATVMNSVVWGSDTGYCIKGESTATFTGSYNDVYGCAAGNYEGVTDPTGARGNLSVTPGFASISTDGNFTNDNWHLSASSSLVDSGNPAAAYNDMDGSTNDIGAYGGPGGAW